MSTRVVLSNILSSSALCCFKRRLPKYIETPESLLTEENMVLPTWENTISFVPPIHTGYVIKVYDGDTITVASKLPFSDSPMYRFQVRMNGIDCPELKSKNDTEKLVAKMAQDVVSKLILGKHVCLENIQMEKYGRLLADVRIGNLNINHHLVENRLAVAYDGGTKSSPKDWLEYYTKG